MGRCVESAFVAFMTTFYRSWGKEEMAAEPTAEGEEVPSLFDFKNTAGHQVIHRCAALTV